MRGEPRLCALILVASLTAPACNAVLGPTPRDTNWHVVDSTHFALYVRPGSFAERSAGTLGTVLDDQYEVTLRVLEGRYDGQVNGFLYDSAADANLASDRSGTAFADTSAFEAVAAPPLDSNLLALLAHEANHVIIINALGRAGTYCLNESLASAVLSERYHWLGKHYYWAWTKAHRAEIPAIARLADDSQWTKIDQSVAYSAGASFLAYLLDAYGPAKLRQLYYAPSDGFSDRFAEIYGRPLSAAEGDWLAFCDRAAY
jgi:hypothetical protein